VYYDGACPVCAREIALYQGLSGGQTIQWVDVHQAQPSSLGPGLAPAAALARLHARTPDGQLISGAAAFVAVWQQLPAFAWAARLARLPGATALLELGYRGFLWVRPLWRPQPSPWPAHLLRELRSDHAGETGAVYIYRGILAVARDTPANAELRAFAQTHLATEQEHLRLVEQVVPTTHRSKLLPLWRLSGFLTGALPTLFGARAVFATIQAVETFVDHHYQQQIDWLDALPAAQRSIALTELRVLLERCRADEVHHRDDAAGRMSRPPSGPLGWWTALVGFGSAKAVALCRRV
jgi:demethoxyubiquinone hydroxylase (CLK1/Coq7/Cat5 family)/predicted DCC family thiol-disulfide oxidoreductase YuxK